MDKHNREILKLALPSVVSNITVPLLGLVDVAIAGHIGDATYIGAIAIGSMIFNIIYWINFTRYMYYIFIIKASYNMCYCVSFSNM